MISKEALSLMGDAKVKLEAALKLLDRTESTCEHCTRKTYHDWDQVQCADNLEAMIRRLDNWIKGQVKKREIEKKS